jgi:hypothetical protein
MDSSFWASFWPNLASTIIGVVIGLPIAIWLNSRAEKRAAKERTIESQTLYRRAILAIVAGLAHNEKKLQALLDALANSNALFDLGLDVTVWDITKDQIVPLLHDPELARRIAFHFATLSTQSRLSNLYLDQFAGIAAALGGGEKTRDVLKAHLVVKAGLLLLESQSFGGDLRQLVPAAFQSTRLTPAAADKRLIDARFARNDYIRLQQSSPLAGTPDLRLTCGFATETPTRPIPYAA